MRRFLLEPYFSRGDFWMMILAWWSALVVGDTHVSLKVGLTIVLGILFAMSTLRVVIQGSYRRKDALLEEVNRRVFSSNASDIVRVQVDGDGNVFADCSACDWRLDLNDMTVSELIDEAQTHREGCVKPT